ncbi:MAG TPA: sterol desaturase family protein [Tianweitania sediminis]|jgi:sterol desaturase/sphingolipid hydroxylase (fatty acid hydroxylase superfamily)|nr:sterol desaturase family protein [Tianweitania sediminis]
MDPVVPAEATVRLIAFLAIFGGMAALELWSPRLERDELRGAWKSRRWVANLGLVVLSSVILRVAFPAAAVGAALWAQANGFGLLRILEVPPLPAGLLAFVLLDFAVWAEHVASHKVPLFWRFHRVHHVDTAVDVTTGLRFHPVEILASMVWKALVVVLLGAPPFAVLLFEIVLNGGAMFSHSNIRLPGSVDRILRRVIVTPDMHRVHHSSTPAETDTNYGFNFAWWDRLFGTYLAQPAAGHGGMEIGLKAPRGRETTGLFWLLRFPFRRAAQKKPIGK